MLATRTTTPARSSSAHESPAPPLTGGARVEVCIAGAGLSGLIAAYLLARDRRPVMVVDDGPIGGLPIGAEVAHLAGMMERPYLHLARLHGEAAARLAAQGSHAAVDAIEAIVRRERIACEFERLDAYAFGLPVEPEAQAARAAGLRDVEALAAPPIEGVESAPCVRYPSQAHFHPLKFVAGLVAATARDGGRIHCGVGTKSIHADSPAQLVTTGGHRIEADVIVSQGMAARVSKVVHVVGLRIPRGSVARALYWDFSGTPRCARLRTGAGGHEVLLAGGEDAPQALEAWARARFPRAGDVVQRYTAGLPGLPDLFAFAGGEDGGESTYVSAASWGTMMTRAAVAGMVIRDWVDGARAPWGELYVPAACHARGMERARELS